MRLLLGIGLVMMAFAAAIVGGLMMLSNGGAHSGVGGALSGLADAGAWSLLIVAGVSFLSGLVIVARGEDDEDPRHSGRFTT